MNKITLATISMILALMWTALSGILTDLLLLIRPLVTLERGLGKSFKSVTSLIKIYKITYMYNKPKQEIYASQTVINKHSFHSNS